MNDQQRRRGADGLRPEIHQILLARLEGTIRCVGHIKVQALFKAAPGSQAARELEQDPNFDGEWGAQPMYEAHALGSMLMAAATEYLEAVSCLLADKRFTFALYPEARACLEAAARGWWLLDPAASPRERVARWVTERLYSMDQDHMLPVPEARQHIEDRRAEVLRESERQGFLIKGQPLMAAEAPRPSMVDVVSDLVEWPVEQGRRKKPGLGQYLARHASSVTHSTSSGLARLLEMVEHPDLEVDQVLATPVLREEEVGLFLTGVLLGYFTAVDRQITFFGWDEASWKGWSGYSARVLRQLQGELSEGH